MTTLLPLCAKTFCLFLKTATAFLLLQWLLLTPADAQPQSPMPVPEWEPSEAVIIRYPFNSNIWPLYAQLIMESQEAARTVLLVNNGNERSTLQNLLASANIPTHNIDILQIPASRMWVRDHGPLTVHTDNGRAFIDFIDYNNSGYNDQVLPLSLANYWGYEHYPLNWILDGGNFMVDSHGTLFTTTRLYSNNPSVSQQTINENLQQYMGVQNIITVNPQHNDYWGHIDMQMKLLNDTTIVISSVQSGSGPNYDILEANVAIIQSLTAPHGKPYHIARLPKADNWKTYANALILNHKIIVPVYNHPNDQVALDTYAALMPNHTVVGINSNAIIGWGGAIHCITMQVPAEPKEMLTLTLSVEGEGIVMVNGEVVQGMVEIESGTHLILEAAANNGFAFAGWGGDVEMNENPLEFTLTDNLEILAIFHRTPGYFSSIVPQRIPTYSNPYDYSLRFTRLTSQETKPYGTAFFFAPTVEQTDFECFQSHSSFLGSHLAMLHNGEELFFNLNQDTIRLKPLAQPGEEWLVFEDPSLRIMGTLVDVKLQDFLGVTDSVKTIGFQAYTPQKEAIDHPVNALSLHISQAHGMVKAVNFLVFPHGAENPYPGNELREMDLLGLSNPDMGLVNLTWAQVHDHQPGDELHVKREDTSDEQSTRSNAIYRFLDRQTVNGSLQYRIERKRETWQYFPAGEPQYTFLHDTITSVVNAHANFDSFAGEPIYSGSYDMFIHHQSNHIKTLEAFHFWENGDCWLPVFIDGCYTFMSYYKGLGGPYYFCDYGFARHDRSLVYYRKGDVVWGTPISLTAVTHPDRTPTARVFPNPAIGKVSVETGEEDLPALWELTDLWGRVVMVHPLIQPFEQINLSALAGGVYLYRIIRKDKTVLSGKIMIQQD
ncbi:MAG: agmatine deiminase family protein [Bacteroidales bacterium]